MDNTTLKEKDIITDAKYKRNKKKMLNKQDDSDKSNTDKLIVNDTSSKDYNNTFRLMLKLLACFTILVSLLNIFEIKHSLNMYSSFFFGYIGLPSMVLISHSKLINLSRIQRYSLYVMCLYFILMHCVAKIVIAFFSPTEQTQILRFVILIAVIICLYSLYVIQHHKDNVEIRFNQKFFIISFILTTFHISGPYFHPLFNYLVPDTWLRAEILAYIPAILEFYVLCSYKKYIQIKNDTKDSLLIMLLATFRLLCLIFEIGTMSLVNVVNTIIGIYIIYKYRNDFFKMLKSFTNNKV